MIQSVWPYVAVLLLAAGLFPSLEHKYRWRLFEFLPPIPAGLKRAEVEARVHAAINALTP